MALSSPPKIIKVEAFPIRLPRDMGGATGTAGSPTALSTAAGAYRWSSTVSALYSENVETALVKVSLDSGLWGWGEAQAPLAPRVPCTIIEDLLAPVVSGAEFDGSASTIESLWNRMYQTMRVRGQTGGFMLDAISGVDLALWDIAGKLHEQPLARLLEARNAKPTVPAYLSGVSGKDLAGRTDFAKQHYDAGFRLFKIFHESDDEGLLAVFDALRAGLGDSAGLAVDALWRLEWPAGRTLLAALETRSPYWLECPFPPDEIQPHRELVRAHDLPLALGESYRTLPELSVFLDEGMLRFVQPDLGRSGITETLRIGRAAREKHVALVPHVSIALGPQIAAAIHTAAAIAHCDLCEYNPNVFEVSNRYLVEPLEMDGANYVVPASPGLGVDIRQEELLRDTIPY